jgi:hypothetical protein
VDNSEQAAHCLIVYCRLVGGGGGEGIVKPVNLNPFSASFIQVRQTSVGPLFC